MNLESQIALISNPQEFTRLCNAVLKARYGDDFLEIDDDQRDRGNDGYLKSEKRMFAGHCFKRLQNRSISTAIREKMASDLAKAIELKRSGDWDIEAWTFLCNYPVSEEIAQVIVRQGQEAAIDVSWSGTGFIAEQLQAHPSVRARFPVLEVNEIVERLAGIEGRLPLARSDDEWTIPDEYSAPMEREVIELVQLRPQGWEYLLFSALLQQGRASLSSRLLDHQVGYARRSGEYLDRTSAAGRLSSAIADVPRILSVVTSVLSPRIQEYAFGGPGEAGSAARIRHIASRVIGCIEELLEWAASLRSLGVSDDVFTVIDAAAQLVDQPITELLQFIHDYAATASTIPALLAANEDAPIRLNQTLTLTIDLEAERNFLQAMQQFEEQLLDS